MSTVDLSALPANCGAGNAPGLVALYVAKAEDVASIPAPGAGTHTVDTDITMEATKLFYKWEFSPGTGKVTMPLEGEIDNKSFGVVAAFQLAKERDEVLYEFAQNVSTPLIAIAETNNGNFFLIGDLKRPAYFNLADYDGGAKGGDPNMMNCEIKQALNGPQPALLYTGTITLS